MLLAVFASLGSALDSCTLEEGVKARAASLVSALSTYPNKSAAQVSVSLTQPLKPCFEWL